VASPFDGGVVSIGAVVRALEIVRTNASTLAPAAAAEPLPS
jgi:hypothetical protein